MTVNSSNIKLDYVEDIKTLEDGTQIVASRKYEVELDGFTIPIIVLDEFIQNASKHGIDYDILEKELLIQVVEFLEKSQDTGFGLKKLRSITYKIDDSSYCTYSKDEKGNEINNIVVAPANLDELDQSKDRQYHGLLNKDTFIGSIYSTTVHELSHVLYTKMYTSVFTKRAYAAQKMLLGNENLSDDNIAYLMATMKVYTSMMPSIINILEDEYIERTVQNDFGYIKPMSEKLPIIPMLNKAHEEQLIAKYEEAKNNPNISRETEVLDLKLWIDTVTSSLLRGLKTRPVDRESYKEMLIATYSDLKAIKESQKVVLESMRSSQESSDSKLVALYSERIAQSAISVLKQIFLSEGNLDNKREELKQQASQLIFIMPKNLPAQQGGGEGDQDGGDDNSGGQQGGGQQGGESQDNPSGAGGQGPTIAVPMPDDSDDEDTDKLRTDMESSEEESNKGKSDGTGSGSSSGGGAHINLLNNSTNPEKRLTSSVASGIRKLKISERVIQRRQKDGMIDSKYIHRSGYSREVFHKTKSVKRKIPEFYILCDTSGSMSSTIDSVNKLTYAIAKGAEKAGANLHLATFNEDYRLVYSNKDKKAVTDNPKDILKIGANGGTRLNQSIHKFIKDIEKNNSKANENVVIIISDGDNSGEDKRTLELIEKLEGMDSAPAFFLIDDHSLQSVAKEFYLFESSQIEKFEKEFAKFINARIKK